MKYTVEAKGIYDQKGLALLTISLAMEYYLKGLDVCNGVAPGIAAAFAIALLTSGLIHSDDSQIDRSSSSSLHESRNCRQRHASRPPSA